MSSKLKSWSIALLFCGAAGMGFIAGESNLVSKAGASAGYLIKGSETMARRMGAFCNIKGNINIEGERIYHLPGQRYYDETSISQLFGERYFCSETEARRAGWRRSRV